MNVTMFGVDFVEYIYTPVVLKFLIRPHWFICEIQRQVPYLF